MPDLSHRPTRYAVAAASALSLATVAAATFDVRVGDDPSVQTAEARTVELLDRVSELQRQLKASDAARERVAAEKVKAEQEVFAQQAMLAEAIQPKASCITYPDQEAAQVAFLADPVGLAVLDGDGDGRACEQLKSNVPPPVKVVKPEPVTPPQEPAPPPGPVLPTAPTKAEIVASGWHFGLSTATTEEFDWLEWSFAWDATLNGYFKGWDSDFDRNRVIASWNRGEIPVMTWESRPLITDDDAPAVDYSLARISNGAFDAYLTKYAQDIAALGLPMVIRFDQEMNGNWYRWSEFESTYGNKKGDFVKAWRHVHDVFEAAGANQHVVWLWSPNRIDNLRRYPAIDGYYPGDAYVDWIGMTGYYRPGDGIATFSATYDKTLAALRTLAPSKPILLSEVGATEDGGKKLAWIQTLFPGLRANPDVAGFIWFNYAKTDAGNTNDWRLDSSDAVFDAFRDDLKISGYGRERGKAPVLVPRVGPPPAPLPEDWD